MSDARRSLAAELLGASETMMTDPDWEPAYLHDVIQRAALALHAASDSGEDWRAHCLRCGYTESPCTCTGGFASDSGERTEPCPETGDDCGYDCTEGACVLEEDIESAQEKAASDSGDDNPAANALDDIVKLCGASDWEYPGQVVRDVALALGITMADMAEIIAGSAKPGMVIQMTAGTLRKLLAPTQAGEPK